MSWFLSRVLGRSWLGPLVILLASAVVYLPLLDAGFVNWDDDQNFLQNEHYRGLAFEQLAWMFTTFHHGGYQPLSWLSLGADYCVWGMDPLGYHLTNLILHAANSLLFYTLVAEILLVLGGRRPVTWASVAAALLFSVHPLRVESVAWITERRGLLAALFWLATLCSYLKAHRAGSRRRRWLLLALASFVCSLLSKGFGLTLPLVLLVLDVWLLCRRGPLGLVLEKLPFVLAALLVGALARLAQVEGGAVRSWAEHGLVERAAQAAYGICFYLRKTLVPVDLSPLYPLEEKLDWSEGRFLLSAGLVFALTVLGWRWRRARPGMLAVWISYLIILAPVLGFTQSGPQLVADRYSYLACLPFALLAGGILASLRERRLLAGLCAVLVLLPLAALCRRQSAVWRSSTALWRQALNVHPESYTARFQLGHALGELERYEQAAVQYELCVERKPSHADAWFNLGMAYYRLGRHGEAVLAWKRRERLRPGEARTLYCLGLASFALERDEDAVAYARSALERAPEWASAFHLMAEAHLRLGETDAAVRAFERVLHLDPGHAEAARRLAELR